MKQSISRKHYLEENWYDCISIRQSRPQENYNKEVFSDNDRKVNSRRKRDDPKSAACSGAPKNTEQN